MHTAEDKYEAQFGTFNPPLTTIIGLLSFYNFTLSGKNTSGALSMSISVSYTMQELRMVYDTA